MSMIENIKSIISIVQKANNIELYRQLLDLQKDALDLIEENSQLRIQLNELYEIQTIQENLIHRENMYFLSNHSGNEDGPFCTKCWDVDRKLVRHYLNDYGGGYCPNCKMNIVHDRQKFRKNVVKEVDSFWAC